MIKLTVNGAERSFDGDPEMPLLWYLRDELGLTGTKFGCGVAACGACTIHVGGTGLKPDISFNSVPSLPQDELLSRILFGTSIYSHPIDDPELPKRRPIRQVLVPSPWVRDMFSEVWPGRVSVWPVGIDTDRWSPDPSATRDIDASGLGVLVLLQKRARERMIATRLLHPGTSVRQMLLLRGVLLIPPVQPYVRRCTRRAFLRIRPVWAKISVRCWVCVAAMMAGAGI